MPDGAKFSDPAIRSIVMPLAGTQNPTTNVTDATAFVAFLDSQAAVDKKKKIGTMGYCMSGPFTMRAAAALPDRIGAGASFHGGGLVTKDPDSPHLLAPKMKAQFLFAIADNDDKRDPDAKTILKTRSPQPRCPRRSRSTRPRTAGARRTWSRTTRSRRTERGAGCSRSSEKRWRKVRRHSTYRGEAVNHHHRPRHDHPAWIARRIIRHEQRRAFPPRQHVVHHHRAHHPDRRFHRRAIDAAPPTFAKVMVDSTVARLVMVAGLDERRCSDIFAKRSAIALFCARGM